MENIKATRMELLKLKRRLKTAQRGYKLLKEKRDGLMKKFTEIVRQIRSQRAALESALADSFKRFALTTSFLHQKELEEMFLVPSASVGVEVHQENVMSVWIPKFKQQIQGDFRDYSKFSVNSVFSLLCPKKERRFLVFGIFVFQPSEPFQTNNLHIRRIFDIVWKFAERVLYFFLNLLFP